VKTLLLATLLSATAPSSPDVFIGTITMDTKEASQCKKVELVDIIVATNDKTKFALQLVFRCRDTKKTNVIDKQR